MNRAQVSALVREFYDEQFLRWPDVRQRYLDLGRSEQRKLRVGGFDVVLLHNPSRARSTEARVDAASIAARPCFLCAANRPPQQIADDSLPGWEILVNPYPIFPTHLTVASSRHIPQAEAPAAMVEFADSFPGLAAFYNGARAGASAPDHLHFQATLAEELPLLPDIERAHTGRASSVMVNPVEAPFSVVSLLVMPDMDGMRLLAALPDICGASGGLFNTFVWKDARGVLRIAVFPRRAHRPACYDAEGDRCRRVSPGAVDMAGVLIVPRREDYDCLTADEVARIYADVSLPEQEVRGRLAKAIPDFDVR